MVVKAKDHFTISETLFFIVITCSLIIPLQSFKFFKPYNLLSNDDEILLITDEGIIKYNSQSNTLTTLKELSTEIINENCLKTISFGQSPSSEGGLIFCRIKNYIYIFDEFFTDCGSFEIETDDICVLNPYKTQNGINTIIVSYIKSNNKLKSIIYYLDLSSTNGPISHYNETGEISMHTTGGGERGAYNKALSCELMASSTYTHKLLVCFGTDQQERAMNAIVFDPEKSLKLVHYSNNYIKAIDPSSMVSVLNPNKKDSIICILEVSHIYHCLTYNSEKNEFTDFITLFTDCQTNQFNLGINYMSEIQEYSVFCSLNYNEMNFVRLDKNYKIKSKDINNNGCYTSFVFTSSGVFSVNNAHLLFVRTNNDYNLLRTYENGSSYTFDLLNITQTCQNIINATSINPNYEDTSETSSTSPKTPKLQTSIIKTVTTIPTSLIYPTSIIKKATTIPTTILSPTSIIKKATTIPTTILSPTSIIKKATTIPTTILSPTSIIKETTTLKTTLISQTSIIKETTTFKTTMLSLTSIVKETTILQTTILSPTSIIKETTTLKTTLISPTSIIKETTKMPISSIPSTLISKVSTLKSTTISLPLSTKVKTTILNSPTTILQKENKSSTLSPSSTQIHQAFPKTTINKQFQSVLKSELLSSTIPSNIFSFPYSDLATTITSKFPDKSMHSSLLFSSIPHNLNKNDIVITYISDGDIIKGKIDKPKEQLEDNLQEIMNEIDIGKKYEINGDDYNLTITPINDLSTVKSTYADFSECEKILRGKLNISDKEILTILQIEIDKMNEKALTSQVEYAIYNEKREKLNLSYCRDVKLKVNYEIKDQSALNKTMIEHYSELGIDIFDREDSFFSDLCYPFSFSESDIILKDRISDVYQNYSLCDNGCDYDNIDIENMTVSCSCQIKEEISMEVPAPALSEMFEETFKDSNFGVIRCYNLVFDFSNKINNMGFLIFSLIMVFHIVCYIIYFINGINNVKSFVFREMERNHYISRFHHPKKKNKITKKANIENESNSYNSHNSGLIMNKNNEEKKIKFENKKNKNVDKKSYKLNINKKLIKSDISDKKGKNAKNNQPIFIFNYKYDNNYYKINNKSYNSSKKVLTCNNKRGKSKKKTQKKEKTFKIISKPNEEKNWPGFYNLIQIDANNSSNKKPLTSKFILDNYNFEQATKHDTRDFWRIFYICLLSKENILNTFFFHSPLEVQPLRWSIFIFTYSCDFAFNALFYFNENISDKYHYEGDSLYLFLFINNIVITVFSTVVSYVIVKLLNHLIDSKESIKEIFRKEEQLLRKNKKYKLDLNKKKDIKYKIIKIFESLKIKIVFFIVFEFLLMLFFLYFITAFCEVYKSTQNSWLYDSFSSFLLSIPLELLISFIISLLYISSIRMKIKFIYNIAMFSYKLG